MSSELERRLEGMLDAAPEPDAGVGEDALARAVSALQPVAPGRRGLRAAVLVFAAAVVLLAIAAGSLAAAGALHVSFGAKVRQRPATPTQLSLPEGANGVAAIVDGRLSVVTKDGFRLQGLPVSAAALSPHALFVAAGIGSSLVAMQPDGHRAWSHPAGGRIVAIAWAPDGLRIAYIVRAGRRLALHVIYGNGLHDTTIDRSARAVRPSWRADSLAFAYAGAGGKAIVYDLGHESRSVFGTATPVTHLAFAPAGRKLLVATPRAVLVGRRTVSGRVEAIGWVQDHPAVALASHPGTLVREFGRSGRPIAGARWSGRVVGFTDGLVVAQGHTRLRAGGGTTPVTPLLGLRPASTVAAVDIR